MTCNGPNVNHCLTCRDDSPYLFDGYCFVECPVGTVTDFDLFKCDCHESCDAD